MGATCRSLTGLLCGLALAVIPATNARADEALAALCKPDEVKVFACTLKSQQQVGFCLGKADLKMRLVVRDGETQASSPVKSLREASIGGNAHGDIITLQGETKDGPVALYVDFIAEDYLPPVLVMGASKDELKQPCASLAFESKTEEVRVGTTMKVARLVGLADIGVAKPLTPVPDWPN